MPKLPDIEPSLVQRARQNDEVAIAQIYEKLNKKAYASAYYILGADERFKENAKTITQDTFQNAFKKIELLRDDDAFAPWFYTSLKNRCLDFFDSKEYKNISKRHIHDLYEDNTSEEFRDSFEETIENENMEFNPDAVANKEEIKKGLNDCLQKLPESQKEALIMYYFQGLTIDEMSEAMNAKTSTIKSWLKRGKESIENQIIQLRKENKSFYSVLPIPALVWVLQEAAKEAPQMDARKFASQIVVEVKASTIEPKKKKHTNIDKSETTSKNIKADNVLKGCKITNKHFIRWIPTLGTPKAIVVIIVAVISLTVGFQGVKYWITKNDEHVQQGQSSTLDEVTDGKRTWTCSKTPIAYEITDYSLMHSTDFMMYDTPYDDGNQDVLMSMYALVGDSETGGAKGRIYGIVAYAVDNNEDDGCVWVAIGNADNGDSRYYVKIADKTAEYFKKVEKKPILYTDYYDVNKFKEACEFNVIEDNQIANLEIDRNSKDFKDDPIYFLRYKEYERYTQLCNGLLAYY